MDKKGIGGFIGSRLKNFKETHKISYFIIVFAVSFTVLLLIAPLTVQYQAKMNLIIAESLIEKYVNKSVGSGIHAEFEYDETSRKAALKALYYNRINPDGTIVQKTNTINMYLESYMPMAFLLSLFFSTRIETKRKIIRTVLAVLLLNLYISLKVSAIAFDNYNYPEFAIADIGGISGGVVYYYNQLLRTVGNSLNFIVVALVWVIFSGITDRIFDKESHAGSVKKA